jgi:FtsH-binding integral membrane protein
MNLPLIFVLLLSAVIVVYVLLPKMKLSPNQMTWLKMILAATVALYLAFDFYNKKKDIKLVFFFIIAAVMFLLIGFRTTRKS